MPTRYGRQTGIINIEKFSDNEIMIVGCGAIGSFVGIALAKMGLTNFKIYDGDRVEEHNFPNQFFTEEDLGKFKAIALKQHMVAFNSKCEIFVGLKFDKDSRADFPIVISCVDKMSVRKMIFESAVKEEACQLFIDCRMAGLQGQVYSVDMTKEEEIENYKKSLFTDRQAVRMRCTERSIVFTVLGTASLVCNQIVKALKEEELSNYIVLDYSVPQMM